MTAERPLDIQRTCENCPVRDVVDCETAVPIAGPIVGISGSSAETVVGEQFYVFKDESGRYAYVGVQYEADTYRKPKQGILGKLGLKTTVHSTNNERALETINRANEQVGLSQDGGADCCVDSLYVESLPREQGSMFERALPNGSSAEM